MPAETTLLTRENILAVISILALLLSVANFIEQRLSNRKNITVSCHCVLINSGHTFLSITLVNNSKLPISITRLRAIIHGTEYDLGTSSVRMFEYEYPERAGKAGDDTTLLPIKIEPLSFSRSLFHIKGCLDTLKGDIPLVIGTNRGTMKTSVFVEGTTADVFLMTEHLR